MHRIRPTQKTSKKVDQVLAQDLEGEEEINTVVFRLGMEKLIQEMLEQEVTDHLERECSERRGPEQEDSGCRNGYER